MNPLETILLGAISSILASFIFWVLTFKWSPTDVLFSDKLEKSNSTSDLGDYRFRFRIANYGRRDLLDVVIKAKIIISLSKINNTFLTVGNDGYIPLLKGRKYNQVYSHILSIYIGDAAIREYKKSFYKNSIKEKALSGDLTLDDILEVYGDKVQIQLFIFGSDSLTGARRCFSKVYTRIDIAHGIFKPVIKGSHHNRKTTIEQISIIRMKPIKHDKKRRESREYPSL